MDREPIPPSTQQMKLSPKQQYCLLTLYSVTSRDTPWMPYNDLIRSFQALDRLGYVKYQQAKLAIGKPAGYVVTDAGIEWIRKEIGGT